MPTTGHTPDVRDGGPSSYSRRRRGCFVVPRSVGALCGTLVLLSFAGAAALVADPDVALPSSTTTSPSPTEAAPKEKVMDVRLPTSFVPIKYLIKLQPFLNGNFSIMGYTEAYFEVTEPTMNVSIHIVDIITKNETIKLMPSDGMNGAGFIISEHKYDVDRNFYIAMLSEPLVPGIEYVLSMEFEGYLNDHLDGFYRSSYTNAQGETVMLAATQFQPVDARRAFPCFDEPALKAKFEIFIAREDNMTSISNMPKINSIPVEGQPGWVWDHFNTTVPMSTYLVAFVVSDFVYINSTSPDEVLFRVWAREEAIAQAEYSKNIGPPMQKFFEKYFDIPFPLPKQDMIALPDFSAGAMENWGLITYRETFLLYDPDVTSAAYKQQIARVVAHEIAHQWFGDLVTMKWWTDLWLNEGFASYLQYIGMDAVETEWNVMDQFVQKVQQSVFGLDSLESSHPISNPIVHPDEISQIFNRITYYKGASIIRMMNHFLGEPTLRQGLTNYLKHFEYKNAEQDDLWRFLTEQAHRDKSLPESLTVKTIMDTWTLQMGYPIIDVELNGEGTATLTQERFLMNKKLNSTDDHDYKWFVPINFVTKELPEFNDTAPSSWMTASEASKQIQGLPAAGNWVIFNKKQTGYYRVNYQVQNWKLLVAQLKENHNVIDITNRAQLVDDALDLARAGRLSYDIALEVQSYLASETEYVPWAAALNNLAYVKGMMSRTPAYGSLKRYLLQLLLPLYNSVGFADNLNDPHLDQFKRVSAINWACSLGHKDCLDNAASLYRQWMENPKNTSIISPNLKYLVFCHGIAEGGIEEWNFGWRQFKEFNVASERESMLKALGCTKETWLLERFLSMMFTKGSGVRLQDISRAFSGVAGNQVGNHLAWDYLRNNWLQIKEYLGQAISRFRNFIKAVASNFNTPLQLQELKDVQEERAESLASSSTAVEQTIEYTVNNIQWMETKYSVIVDWLHRNGYRDEL